jgi:hypothetical protein
MRRPFRTNLPLALLIGGCLFISRSPARAQGPGSGPSLGGYGAMSGEAMRAGGGSPIPIPYAGGFAGFMPYRMAGSGAPAVRARPTSAMGPLRTSFSRSSVSSGMSSMSGRIRLGGGMRPSTSRPGGMGVMPPSFGYPFRQPPSLLSPSAGMSASMP